MAKRHFKSPETCAFSMRVYYKNGSMKTFHSKDFSRDHYEPHEGLLELEEYLIRNSARIRTGIIYDRRALLAEQSKPAERRKKRHPKMIRLYTKGQWKLWSDVELQ